MSDIDALKAEIRKLASKASQAKMNLHDLSEDLPINWQGILGIAQETYDAYAALDAARSRLKTLEEAV